MIQLAGYTIKQEIHSSEKTSIYQGDKSGSRVIIKLLKHEFPSSDELQSFKNEFDILKNLNSNRIVKALSIEKYKNSLAIVFEDIEGKSLSSLVADLKNDSLIDKIKIFIQATLALGEIHKLNLVHKDIKPQNIIFNKKTNELQIIDFGSASFLAKQNSAVSLNSSLEGTLAYISPEQTGRMNRTVDYRTDFYSLGISFYQLFTGELPFSSTDAMELIHSHIAKTAISPEKKNNIPKAISEIVLKLMMKNPEDRYQSIEGILFDLEKCKTYLQEGKTEALNSNDFLLGEKDLSGKFQIPEKLYGREKEISLIVDTFKNVANGNLELILISGRSGIGKSILINEINKPITEFNGYFISGKYDSFKKSIPYRAITQAFQSLIGQILTEPQDKVLFWKEKILKAVGVNGKIIIEFIPELDALIGDQPEVALLDPTEAQNRFNLVFLSFMKSFCTKENPIAIFLDDLQWADNASIQLLETILSDSELKYLYLMLSFRDNEVLATDAFADLMEKLKNQKFHFNEIILNPISLENVNQLISDTLTTNLESSKILSEVIYNKTKGNPFFVNEVFKELYDKNLIFFLENKWGWDISKIKEVKISDNVIDLMVEKVKELSSEQLRVLKLAACIGSWFKLEVFYQIYGSETIYDQLIILGNEGFLRLSNFDVNFAHDKIREATYTLITDDERSLNHYKIGTTYLSILEKYKLEDHVFTIVNQLNQGIDQITTDAEKSKLIELNILAAEKSLSSLAYEAATKFFTKSLELSEKGLWTKNYSRALELNVGLGTSLYLNKSYDEAEKTFDIVLNNAENLIDKIPIYELKFSMYVSQSKFVEVLTLIKKVIQSLGINLPNRPSELSPLPEIIKSKIKLGKKSISSLSELARNKDLKVLAAMRILNSAIAPAFLAQPALFPVIVLKMLNLSLSKGNSPSSPFAYTAFGMIQGFALGDFNAGYEFGKLGIDLINKLDSKSFKCRTYFLFAGMINHWKQHAREGVDYFLQSFHSGQETGDLQYSSYSLNNIHFQASLMRKPLLEISEMHLKYNSVMNNLKQQNAYQLFKLNEQITLNLMGLSENSLILAGEYFKELEILPEWETAQNANGLFQVYLGKVTIHYILGDKKEAYIYSNKMIPFEPAMFGMMFIPEHVFFNSLICFSLIFETEDKKQKKEFAKQIEKNLKRMKKWAENCEANYGHKYFILDGIQHKINGNDEKAIQSFKTAVLLARKHEYILEEAIANELCSEIWFSRSDESYAELHLREAHYAYKKWGCIPKVKQLEEKFPQLIKKAFKENFSTESTGSLQSTTKMTTKDAGSFLDLSTVLKASQTIAGEIHLGKLLERMLKILFENAGAERGFFILKEKDKWLIQAEGNSNTDTIEVLQAVSLADSNLALSPAIMNYVIRTKTLVILDDAAGKGVYTNDPYIKTKKPKSVLCYPIINQGNLVGVVYLENNQTTNAFTPDRIEILKILSSQIAVSIENSLLYSNLEEKVMDRTRDLNQALVEVRSLKEQQDGDYFLTTLLIEPLAQNNAALSEALKIEFFIKQKKKFEFRKGEYEIGGDINITETIELKDRKYTLFLNGDAMGKSIQGAGGVLVLGTVFKSIVQRTTVTAYGKSVYPERWLKNAFIEMHKVFESFEGSMLMSLVFGLIDEITGTMYFIGAEHPDVILYRDGKASFLENQNQYRKLGTQGQKGNIQVEVFSFQPSDILIFGSDGRDDIILGKNPVTGKDEINNDEMLILRNIEKANADLTATYEEILKSGKQFDDLSLLRIEWTGNTIVDPVYEMESRLFQDYIEDENYQLAEPLGLKLIEKNPSNSELLYKISIGLNKMEKFEEAIDLGERLFLRNPKHQKNLICLIGSYISIGNLDRAKSLWKQGEKLKILNEELRKIGQEFQL